MRQWVRGVGTVGINKDAPAELLPQEWWTDALNVSFRNGKVRAFEGVTEITVANGDTTFFGAARQWWQLDFSSWFDTATNTRKLYILGVNVDQFWSVYTKVGSEEGNEILPASSVLLDFFFPVTFENIGNRTIIADFNLDPLMWVPTAHGTNVVLLTDFPDATFAAGIRSFKNHLVAFNINDASNSRPYMVWWSHPYDPGTVPSSWDYTDPAVDAGRVELDNAEAGEIRAAMTLGDTLFLYRKSAIWAMTYVGPPSIFGFKQICVGAGLGCMHSLVTIPNYKDIGAVHFFVDKGEMYIFDGFKTVQIGVGIISDWLTGDIHPTYAYRGKSMVYPKKSELWFAYPAASGIGQMTRILIWNYKYDTFTFREVGSIVYAMGSGWIQDSPGSVSNRDSNIAIIENNYTSGKFYKHYANNTLNYAGTPMSCYVQRDSLPNIGTTKNGEPVIDHQRMKTVKAVVVRGKQGSMYVSIGTQQKDTDPITWTTPALIPTDKYRYDLPKPVLGRLISFKFSNYNNDVFAMTGFDYELEIGGEF